MAADDPKTEREPRADEATEGVSESRREEGEVHEDDASGADDSAVEDDGAAATTPETDAGEDQDVPMGAAADDDNDPPVAPRDGGGDDDANEDQTEKAPPSDGAAATTANAGSVATADSATSKAEAKAAADETQKADRVEEAIPPYMIESDSSLMTDLDRSPLPSSPPDDGKSAPQRGEKRTAKGDAAPPTPPLTEKPPAPRQQKRAGDGGKNDPGDGAGKPRRNQRQKQKQRVAGPAGAAGVAAGGDRPAVGPRKVQQRRRAPQQPQANRAQPPAQPGAQPQQRVVLGVPSWLGSTFSAYAGSINRRTAMTLLGVTAVVGASIGSVVAMGGAHGGGDESGVRGTTSGGGGATGTARGSGGMAARSSAPEGSTSSFSNVEPLAASEILALNGSPPPADTPLPAAFSVYADFDSPAAEGDVPLFLHVPRSGGLTVMEILSKCLELVVAGGEAGASKGAHGNDEELLVIETPSGSYVNCDPTTPMGIERCQSLNLIQSGLADVVSSPLPFEASSLFTGDRRGRMFALLRPVVDRVVSHFRWIQTSGTDPYVGPDTDLAQYVRLPADRPEFNWLTKALAGKPGTTTDILTLDDLNVAKEALRKKAVVGLLPRKGDSMLRFERTFGWDRTLTASPERKKCEEETLHWEWKGKAAQFPPSSVLSQGVWAPGTELHAAIERRNAFDVDLYRYAERLFEEQMVAFDPNANAGPYDQQEQQQQQPSLESSAPAVPLSNDVGALTTSVDAKVDDLFRATPTASASAGSPDFCRKELLLSAVLAALVAAEI